MLLLNEIIQRILLAKGDVHRVFLLCFMNICWALQISIAKRDVKIVSFLCVMITCWALQIPKACSEVY